MINCFDYIASVYDCLNIQPDPIRLRTLLGLPAEGRLLDAGGGTGRVSLPLRFLVGAIVISDLSRPMLQQARRKGIDLTVQARTEQMPFPDGSFSRIIVVDALHHFGNQSAAIGELSRLLTPPGRLVIVEPDINRLIVKVVSLMERLMNMGIRFLPADEIREMLARQSLRASIAGRDRFRVWIVADKT